MNDMVLKVQAGETAYLQYSGIHDGRIRLMLADGDFVDFVPGSWADQRRADQGPAMVIDGNRFFAFEYRLETSYVVFVHDEEAGGGFRPAVRIEGTGIAGNRSDRVILRQVSPKGGYESHCDRRYAYGWDVVNGEAPLDSGSDQ